MLMSSTSAKAQDGILPPPPPPPESYQEYNTPQRLNPDYRDNRECYRILVSRSNGLSRVRRVVSDAFVYGNAIQAGYECGRSGMRRLTNRLVSNGLRGVSAIQVSNGQIVGDRPYPGRPYPDRPYPGRCSGYGDKYYYVVVPAISSNLPELERQVRRTVKFRECVEARNEPRGAHVRVGPFDQRAEAEDLNRYLRGRRIRDFSNTRVYYGK